LIQLIIPESGEVLRRRFELLVWSFLLSLAFYPGPFGFLAWLSLVRPLMIISRLEGREVFTASYFFSFCFNAFSLYWVAQVTPPGIIAAVTIVAFYYTAILASFNLLYRFNHMIGLVAAPFLWTGLEYFRTLTEFAFPWSDLGYTQSYFLYILQIVSVTSVHGLTFLIVVVNILVWQILRKELSPERRLTSFWVVTAVVAGLVAYGWVVTPRLPNPGEIDIAVLQGSVPIEEKWADGNQDHSFDLYDSLAVATVKSTEEDSVELFIWPETSAPSYLTHDHHYRSVLHQTALRTNAYHLVGALGATENETQRRYYNSAFMFSPSGGKPQRHDKVKLVPFTEQVPYQEHLPFLRREFLTEYLTFIKTFDVQWWSDFYPGDSAVLFSMGDHLFGCLICFESTFPEFSREMILDGADFIVGITNDTWFGHSLGIHMHSRFFVTRAVENRCWMARAANSGLSYIVDSYGRIRYELPLDAVASLRGKIRPLDGFSFFTRHGDIVGMVSFLISVLLTLILVLTWIIRKFKRNAPHTS